MANHYLSQFRARCPGSRIVSCFMPTSGLHQITLFGICDSTARGRILLLLPPLLVDILRHFGFFMIAKQMRMASVLVVIVFHRTVEIDWFLSVVDMLFCIKQLHRKCKRVFGLEASPRKAAED